MNTSGATLPSWTHGSIGALQKMYPTWKDCNPVASRKVMERTWLAVIAPEPAVQFQFGPLATIDGMALTGESPAGRPQIDLRGTRRDPKPVGVAPGDVIPRARHGTCPLWRSWWARTAGARSVGTVTELPPINGSAAAVLWIGEIGWSLFSVQYSEVSGPWLLVRGPFRPFGRWKHRRLVRTKGGGTGALAGSRMSQFGLCA
jgi:hypothetical protein